MGKIATALVLGYGRSGRAAERLLRAEGAGTVVLDEKAAGSAGIEGMLGEKSFDACIASPGFALSHPWIGAVRAAGVPLLSELELGWSRHRGRTVAVTGSNGKSTAVKWICEALQAAGRSAAIGGNYGIPACETVMEHPDLEWLVLEASSFQLETVRDFSPEVAIVLNVLPNHLDRHGTMEAYRRAKARIFGPFPRAGQACIAPAGLLGPLRADTPGARIWTTFGAEGRADFRFESGRVLHGAEAVLDLAGTPFDSPILGGCTGAAVAAAARACGIPYAAAERAAKAFEPLPHRLQRLGEIGGVAYINDSKATNLAATLAALQACGKGVHLLAGGLPKEADYTFAKEILAERAKSVYLFGQASRAMYQAWSGVCPCVECGTLEAAFSKARAAARSGEAVLLSPACASFDQFGGFEERGERFFLLFRAVAGGDAT